MRFAIWDHAGKGGYLRQQLLNAGHATAETVDESDMLILDCDWAWAHPRPELIQAAHDAGAKVVLYPHGGLPTVFVYDGLTVPDPLVDLRLEHGRGSIDTADQLGLALKQEAPGWLYSPTQPFKPVDAPKKILFAPQHPNMEMLLNGSNGHDPGPAANRAVYGQLIRSGYDVTVSVVGPLWRNGIYPHPTVKLVSNHEMRYDQSWALVQEADVVIAAGTMAATAVASGKPTVMLGQGHYADYVDGRYVNPDHVGIYDELLRYPLDANQGDLETLIGRACAGDSAAAAWRERHIGDDGTLEAVRLIERICHGKASSNTNATIREDFQMTDDTETTGSDEAEAEPQHVLIEGVTATAGAAGNEEE